MTISVSPQARAYTKALKSKKLLAPLCPIGVGAVVTNGPRCEKTGLLGFRPGTTQTRLYSHRRRLVA